jgi:hypothetical protein
MAKYQEKITLKFDGQNHQVDLTVFTSVLMNYMTIVNTVAEEQGSDVDLLIDATEQGSLDAIIAITTAGLGILDAIKDNSTLIDTVVGVVTCTTGVFALKKKLKGAKRIDRIETKGDNNVVIIAGNITVETTKDVANVYENRPDATRKVDEIFRALSENPEITGFEFRKDNEIIFRAEASEFSEISSSPNYEGEEVRHIDKTVTLKVVKPFLGISRTRKWEFVLNNCRISAPVIDDAFLKRIEEKEISFTAGTTLKAKMDVEQFWDYDCSAWLNRSYVVKEVLEVCEGKPLIPEKLF